MFGAQILTGVAAAALSFDFAFAQSPAARSVYNTATSVGSLGGGSGYGMQPQSAQGINAFGSGSAGGAASPGMGSMGSMGPMGSGADAQGVQTEPEWESIEVDAPEYVYRGHTEKEPITSLEFYSFADGSDGYAV